MDLNSPHIPSEEMVVLTNEFLRRELPKLKLSPAGYKYNGSVFDKLFDSILAFWDEKFYDVLCAYYDNANGLSGSLKRLGFDDDIVNGALNMLSFFYAEFGKEAIEIVLSMETIETFATILLDVEVERFSKEITKGDDDAPSSPMLQHTVPSVTTKYPEWLMELHKIATEKGVTVIFTDDDPACDNLEQILPPIEYWPPNVEYPTVDVYHACAISARCVHGLTSTLTSFIEDGVRRNHHGRNRAGFLSSRPAAYFTNSYLYARFWPHLKTGLENYSNTGIPRPSMLICYLRLDSEEFFGRNGRLSTARITTSDRDTVADVPSCTNTSLILDQFVRMNLNQKPPPPSRLPIPGMGNWTKDADIIVSGLIRREMDDIERTDTGKFFQYIHDFRRLSFAAACTKKAVDYMKMHTTKIIVLGFGNGKIGKDCSTADFGTAGIARGFRDYRWSS